MKIRDRERVEPPHVTILRGTRAWRLDLRTQEFMDDDPDPAKVSKAVLKAIRTNWELLCATWDEMYPENPIRSEEENDE